MASQWNAAPLAGHPRWEYVATLGKGAHSMVQLARDRLTGEMVAIKFIQRGGGGDLKGLVAQRACG
jgi:hypothetical protein